MEATARYSPNDRNICLSDNDRSESKNGEYKMNYEEENIDPNQPEIAGVMKKKLKGRRSLMKRQGSSRRRRRSSARFLKLLPYDDEGDDTDGVAYDSASTTNLGEVYRNAIRMNAENRINASNSWNLNLIDHLDQFVAPEIKHMAGDGTGEPNERAMKGMIANNTSKINNLDSTPDSTLVSGVNFTKASCTLDASVKIYSYRVDDVHLTSYKVLANLNRTDNNTSGNKKKNPKTSADLPNHSADNEEDSMSRTNSRTNTNAMDTLELNTANINIHKLDAAFDIDPLFHKMSKTFDEGGAKGLLLANLGVGHAGCNIVFDSSLDIDDIPATSVTINDGVVGSNGDQLEKKIEPPTNVGASYHLNSPIKVSGLRSKLESLLSDASENCITIESIPLVPQLSSLRNQYANLGKDGFVEEVGISSKRYASSLKDEAEADKSIHLEAIERSRVSQADLGRSHISRGSMGSFDSDGDPSYGESGFGYGGGDDDIFGDLHDGDHRFSSSSFAQVRNSFSSFGIVGNDANSQDDREHTLNGSRSPKPAYSQAIALLDAIASGDITTEPENQYEYFNSQALKSLSSGNVWAGAEHWKKMYSARQRVKNGSGSRNSSHEPSNKTKEVKGKRTKAFAYNTCSLVTVANSIEGLTAMLQKPKRGRTKNVTDPLQLTKAMRRKYSDNDNLLPLDAGLGVRDFITLFSRANENLIDFVKSKTNAIETSKVYRSTKVVGFSGLEPLDTDDASGTGFDFGDSDDGYEDNDDPVQFVVPTLDDVRKVDKIDIGYATVARKIDVKRLKRDLWTELEQTFSRERNTPKAKEEVSDNTSIISVTTPGKDRNSAILDDNHLGENDESGDAANIAINGVASLSFQETVHEMQMSQSQADVTVPFYFICILHLCNEKGLALESSGLDDFVIHDS